MGRLVDEGMPLETLSDLDLVQLGRLVAGPWFGAVSLTNTENRRLVRGRGRSVTSGAEPIFTRRSDAKLRVQPGDTRADILRYFMEPVGLLAWSSGDGSTLHIGQPNYRQVPQFELTPATTLAIREKRSVAERYRDYTAYAGTGRRRKVRSEAADTSGDFLRAKSATLRLPDARTQTELDGRLATEVARSNQSARDWSVTVQGIGQRNGTTDRATLFAFDTMARVRSTDDRVAHDALITAVTMEVTPTTQRTTLRLVPRGTALSG
jgi:prophage tail gpP-like protein